MSIRNLRPLLVAGLLLAGSALAVDAPPGATGTPDPTAEDCRQALGAARTVIARLPATHPERFALERTVSDASNEGGSGEYDECVELAERARERAETLLAQDPSPT